MAFDKQKPPQNKGEVLDLENYPEGLYMVKLEHSSETEICVPPSGMKPENGDMVFVKTRYGNDMVRVLGPVADAAALGNGDVKEIIRGAGPEDFEKAEAYKKKEDEAFRLCREKIEEHHLEMVLVSAHYLLGEQKLMFFFTAENRVDFRALVKNLVSLFRIRIELRQIGVRDESRVLGGLGSCGRSYCCHGVTDKLKPVSIKMAKEQKLSLNSMKISGPCGRLLCCLSYEYDYYHEEKKRFPNEGSRIQWDGAVFRVTDVNIFSRRVCLNGNDGRCLNLGLGEISYNQDTRAWELNPLGN